MLHQSPISRRLVQLAAVVAIAAWLNSLAKLGGVQWVDRYGLTLALMIAAALVCVAGSPRSGRRRWFALAIVGLGLGVSALILPRVRADGFILPLALWASLFIATTLADRSDRWVRGILALAVVAGTVEALFGWSQLFGLLATSSGNVKVATGTFFNRNHFAGFVAPVLPLALAFALAPGAARFRNARQLAAALAAGSMAAAVLFSRSRGGVASVVFALLVLAILLSGSRGIRTRVPRIRIAVLWGLMALALALGVVLARRGVASRLDEGLTEEGRWVVWSDTLLLIGDHPLVGVGPGGYGDQMRRYQSLPAGVDYVHAHNAYLETAADWGIPLAFVLWFWIGRTAWCTVVFAYREGDLLMAGCGAAIAAFLVHALVDFNLRMPASGALFFALLGIGWVASGRRAGSAAPSVAGSRWSFGMAVALTLVCLANAVTLVPRRFAAAGLERAEEIEDFRRAVAIDPESAEARFRLGKELLSSLAPGDRVAAAGLLQGAIDLAPSRWGYYLEAARAQESVGDLEAAERTYRRALELNPSSGGYHWQWTNFLVRQGRVSEAAVAAVPAAGLDYRVAGDAFVLLVRSGAAPMSLRELWLERPVVAQAIAARLVETDEQRRLAGVEDTEALLSIGRTAFVPISTAPSGDAQRFVSLILSEGDAARARELWSAMLGAEGWNGAESMVWDGDFDRPLVGGGLGWSVSRELEPAVQLIPTDGVLRLRPVLLRDRSVWMRQRIALVHRGTVRLEVTVAESRLGEGVAIEIDLVDTKRRAKIGGLSIRDGEVGRHSVRFEITATTSTATLRLSRIGESSATPSSLFEMDSLVLRTQERSE